MKRILLGSLLSLSLLASCSAAYADRVAPAPRPLVPIAIAPEAVRSPYSVQIISETGEDMDTFFQKGRYYVHGAAGQRYIVRVTNPTAQRVEAVISIDGLDVIDGEAGDLRKRGYVVPPYGTLDIEGWRTSLTDVSAFRFSSVGASYAGRKGKARNVGVIAVALFAEQAAPAIIIDPPYRGYHDDEDGYGPEVEQFLERRGGVPATPEPTAPVREGRIDASKAGADRVAAKRPAAPPPPADAPPRVHTETTTATADEASDDGGDYEYNTDRPSTSVGGSTGSYAPGAGAISGTMPAPRTRDAEADTSARRAPERLGLGTEFGEQRYSAANYTRFVRGSERPIAIAELRYNDTAGLRALGIIIDPLPDAYEIDTRETADPFPGDRTFARPPAGIR